MILKTFSDSFPHVLLGFFMPALKRGTYNTILIGSNEPVSLDAARMRRYLESEREAFGALARYGLATPEIVLAQFVADGEAIRKAVAAAPDNTLVHPRYEFYSPSDYALPRSRRLVMNIEFLMRLRRAAAPQLLSSIRVQDPAQRARLEAAIAADDAYLTGFRRSLSAVSATEIFRQYDAALARAPWNENLRARILLQYSEIAASQRDAGVRAMLMERAISAYDKSALAHVNYSLALGQMRDMERALQAARTAVDLDPNLIPARRTLAWLLVEAGREQEAETHLRELVKITKGADGAVPH